jgi:hypothetical protein
LSLLHEIYRIPTLLIICQYLLSSTAAEQLLLLHHAAPGRDLMKDRQHSMTLKRFSSSP